MLAAACSSTQELGVRRTDDLVELKVFSARHDLISACDSMAKTRVAPPGCRGLNGRVEAVDLSISGERQLRLPMGPAVPNILRLR
ncbi:unnamed protein product, partial [Symbiodinium sp. KB8]